VVEIVTHAVVLIIWPGIVLMEDPGVMVVVAEEAVVVAVVALATIVICQAIWLATALKRNVSRGEDVEVVVVGGIDPATTATSQVT